MSLPEQIAITLIKGYRLIATPVKISLGLQGCCRFSPSCSHYVQEAILTHGLVKGTKLGARRLLRCHPWSDHGYDPVPGSSPGMATPHITHH